MISVNNLGKAFGDQTLFEGASFQLNAGFRYGLVGANGSGKTTFLQILSGNAEASMGTVSMPKQLRLGVLQQDQFLYGDEPILNVTMMGNTELWEAIVAKEALLAAAHEHFDTDRFGELEELVQHHDGYTAESRAATILDGLGLPASVHNHPLSTLSGGFKLRVLLAQVLASAPDVLLLDEPTNHLDILSIRWLETFMRDFSGPVIVISHDHQFLDGIATHILDIDYETVTLYHGNYTAFLEEKRHERERREKDIAGQEREIAHQQEFVNRFKAKATKARQAQSKAKIIEKKMDSMVALAQSSRRYPTFNFEEWRPSGRDVLKVKGIEKAYGDNEVLHGIDLLVHRGDRLAIMGPNGIGKSTLLKIIMGEVEPDAGEVTWGYETHPGYFAQDHREQLLNPTRSAHEWMAQFCPDKDIGFVRGRLALMLFTGDDPKKRLSALSGGEAARLVFASIALARPNVLVLDEPTNHLDLESIEALVEGLRAYTGTLILVSHDRWFINQLATRIVDIEPQGVTNYQGTYEEYVAFTGDDHLDVEKVVLKAKNERRKKSTASIPPSAAGDRERELVQDRHEELMRSIEVAESRITEIDALFADASYYAKTSVEDRRSLEIERTNLAKETKELTAAWEQTEEQITAMK
ncbi:MAG TPA: ABC-F family ATPase [Gemmatimonadetes bacterium]|nr:ABC-F family ATPase [Gemmatimonadota bacterium]|tara:strand:+ start:6513 stop:8429 length:1917 start_codon:yes stop_codon:yes gene_type:complete